jgi:hypothetical protein
MRLSHWRLSPASDYPNRFRLPEGRATSDLRDDDSTASKQLQTFPENIRIPIRLPDDEGSSPDTSSVRLHYESSPPEVRMHEDSNGAGPTYDVAGSRSEGISIEITAQGSRHTAVAIMYLSKPLPMIGWAAISSSPHGIQSAFADPNQLVST